MTQPRTTLRASITTLSILFMGMASAIAGPNALALDPGLNLLVFNNFAPPSSDVEGRVAVGGNATIGSYSINAHQLAGTALTVGGNLSFVSGSIAGSTVVGGNLTSNYSGSFGGNVAVAGALNASQGFSGPQGSTVTVWGAATGYQKNYAPTLAQGSGSFSQGVDFSSLQASMNSLSTRLGSQTAIAAVDIYSTLTFNASNAHGLNVFDITAAQAAQNMQINGLASDGTVIINVMGSTVSFGSHGFTNFNNRVLFNLPTATTLALGYVDASILAPLASVSGGYGVVNGQVVVNNWASSVQVNDRAFAGNLPLAPVPEPETYAMLLAGLGLVGLVTRRRKARNA